MKRRPRAEWLALAAILLLAALARYTGLTEGFPRDFHWDERIYFHEALYAIANGLRRESTVSANLPYLLVPVLLADWLGGLLTGTLRSFGGLIRAYIVDPIPVLLAGRILWAATGVATVAAVYRLGRRFSGPAIGLLAAFFLAGTFLHAEQGHFIKNDVPAGLFLALALDGLFSMQERGARRDYLWAGFWIGLATATKYYCAAAVPLVLLAHWTPGPRRAPQTTPQSRRGTTVRLALAALGAAAGFIGTTPVLLTDPENLRANIAGEIGARFGSIPTGDTPQWMFYLTDHLAQGMGPFLLGLALAGGLFVLLRRPPKGLLLVGMLLLFFIAVNLRPNNFARYIIPALPFLCLLAAIALRTIVGTVLGPGLARLRALARESTSPLVQTLTAARVLRLLAPAALGAGALVATAPSWANIVRYDRYAVAPDARNAAQAWFETHVPAGAEVLIEGGESFERTSNLGPQLWPTAQQLERRGPNEPRERFFWQELLPVVAARPAYSLTLVGAVERTSQEVNGRRVAIPVRAMEEWGDPDYAVLINWRSDDLRPGSTDPLWASLTTTYTLAATFPCAPCFPDDYYAWRIDYPTLRQIPLIGGPPLLAGPEVRVFQRKTTRFPARPGP